MNIILCSSDSNKNYLNGAQKFAKNIVYHFDNYYIVSLVRNANYLNKIFKGNKIILDKYKFNELSLISLVRAIIKSKKVIVTGGIIYGIIAVVVNYVFFLHKLVFYRSGGVIFIEREIAKGEKGRNSILKMYLENIIWKLSNYIIIPSDIAAQNVVDKYPSLLNKMIVIPNYFKPSVNKIKVKIISKETGIIRIVSIASLYRIKGLDILIKSIKYVKKNVELSIIGTGNSDYEKYLLNLSKEIVNLKNISIYKNLSQEKVTILLKKADIYIQPSRFDVFPNSVIEAYIEGLPIIVSNNIGTFSDVLKDENVSVFNYSDRDLAEKINFFLSKGKNLIYCRNLDFCSLSGFKENQPDVYKLLV